MRSLIAAKPKGVLLAYKQHLRQEAHKKHRNTQIALRKTPSDRARIYRPQRECLAHKLRIKIFG